MHQFLETTFGPEELEILDIVLEEWRARRGLPKSRTRKGFNDIRTLQGVW